MPSLAQLKADASKIITSGKSAGGGLSFPASVQSGKYMTMLTFTEYERSTPSEKPKHMITDTIVLPLPMQIEENYNINYNQVQMGGAMVGLQAGESLINTWSKSKDAGAFAVEFEKKMSEIMQNRDNIYDAGVTIAENASFFSQSLKGAVQLSAKSIQNPHTTSILESVPLRIHQFSWILSPQSAAESQAIRQIIDRIRWNSLPESTSSGLRMTFPSEVTVKFLGSDKFPILQKSVVTSLQVNQTPQGFPSFFADGSPTAYQVTMQLQEVTQVTRKSFEDSSASTGSTTGIPGLNPNKLAEQLPSAMTGALGGVF